MIFIEICAANIQSALAAQKANAHRIELCSGLDAGGLTPSPGLIRAAIDQLSIPVCVLIRPREGNFHYDSHEVEIMLADIHFCKEAGAAGVVVGALTADFMPDVEVLKAMKKEAGAMEVIHHRAFDFVRNPDDALEILVELGYCRVLTSGQAEDALAGSANIARWVKQAGNRISMMPGGGIKPNTIVAVKAATGAHHFHLTAKKWIEQPCDMPIPGLPGGYYASDVENIKICLEQIGD